jgi:catechol-2,3-dioxygenase
VKESKTYGLTHLAIAVKDLETSSSFYQAVFDMEVMYKEENFIQLTTPGRHDIIVFEKKKAPFGKTGGIIHFGFRLIHAEDVDEMAERIQSAGGKITSKGEFCPGEPFIFFKDPDGYEVEVWYELNAE